MGGLFKADVIHRLGPWTSADAVERETLKWVDWFNNRRLLDPIGYITPAEAEEAVYANMNACRYSRVRRPKQSPVKPGRFRAIEWALDTYRLACKSYSTGRSLMRISPCRTWCPSWTKPPPFTYLVLPAVFPPPVTFGTRPPIRTLNQLEP
jgi:hypothetical protein